MLDHCGRSVLHLLNYAEESTAAYLIVHILYIHRKFNQHQQHKLENYTKKLQTAFQSIDKFGHSALYYLVQTATPKNIEKLIDRFELEINCPSEDQSPLHIA